MADKHNQEVSERFESLEPLAQSPEEARSRARVLIYSAVPKIVDALIDKTKRASLPEAKLVLELFGLGPETAEPKSHKPAKSDAKPAKESGPSDDDVPPLARVLMDTLGAIQREEIKF